MKIRTRKEGSTVIVPPSGRLDGAGAPVLEAALLDIARRGDGSAVLDGGGIGHVSSAGLRALLVGAKAFALEGAELSIAALRPECRTVMELSGLLSILKLSTADGSKRSHAWRPGGFGSAPTATYVVAGLAGVVDVQLSRDAGSSSIRGESGLVAPAVRPERSRT